MIDHFQLRFLLPVALLLGLAACGGGSSSSGGTEVNPVLSDPAPSGNDDPPGAPMPANGLIASTSLPVTGANSDISWPFAPTASTLELDILAFVELPPARGGQPARWNDMDYLGERLFIASEIDARVYEITGREPRLWFDVGSAVRAATGRNVNTDNPWHGGLRSIAFHPDFATNGKFYASLLEDRPADPSQHHYLSDDSGVSADSVLVEWTANPGTLAVNASSYREVFRVGIPQFDHPIKQIAFNPHASRGDADFGLLYIAHGDGSAEASTSADGEGNHALGKILRIDPLARGTEPYGIPPGNPFVDDASMLDEVFSIGHRNPHHLAFLPNGSLLATESGHDNIDEVNRIEAGANYGWSRREGAFVHLESGGLGAGIAALPDDDADNDLSYPVMQFGHTGPVGANFVGQSLGGGYTTDNGSALDGEFFTVEFVRSGRLFHNSTDSLLASRTTGQRDKLTMAESFEAAVRFDDDGDASTPSRSSSLPDIVQGAGGYDGSGRVDVRIGQGPFGELYLMNKRNNIVYLVRNSWPPGRIIPSLPDADMPTAGGVPDSVDVTVDITVPAYVSNALQVRITWGDRDLAASYVVDESWRAVFSAPADTEQRLLVTFFDRNGDITLGTVEQPLRTGINDSETVTIMADQFDTGRWDDDGDGISNLAELRAGGDPLNGDQVRFSTVVESLLEPRCDGCHSNRSPSGGLDLSAANAYANLVNRSSSRKEGATLVIPFDPDNSYLVQKMEDAPGIAGRAMDYGPDGSAQLVRDWIAAGALND